MAQDYCNRLVEEAKNHYYILGGRLYQNGENQHFIKHFRVHDIPQPKIRTI